MEQAVGDLVGSIRNQKESNFSIVVIWATGLLIKQVCVQQGFWRYMRSM